MGAADYQLRTNVGKMLARPKKVPVRVDRYDGHGILIAQYGEGAICGTCGHDLGWTVLEIGTPPLRAARKPPGWLATDGTWYLGPRARARRSRGAKLDYDPANIDAAAILLGVFRPGYLVELPVAIKCPRCGQRQELDLHPRSQEELQEAYVRGGK